MGEWCVCSVEKGALKVSSHNRTPEEPIPGRGGIEVKSRFQVRAEEDSPIPPASDREAVPRRTYIRREGVSEEEYGLTFGCKGCEAANRGSTGIHNEQCRKRIDLEVEKKEPDRFNRVIERLGSSMGRS